MSANSPLADALTRIGDDISRSQQAWQALPLAEKSLRRAGRGAWVLTLCAYLVVEEHGDAALPLLVVPALFGLLWLAAGVHGAHGIRDVVRGVWYAIGALFCAALLWVGAYPADWGPTAAFWLRALYLGWLAEAGVRCWLALRPPPRMKLPDPVKLGMPMAGPATVRAAHAALSRQRSAPRPKFRT